MLPQQLISEVAALPSAGHDAVLEEESGAAVMLIRKYEVPPGYSASLTDLLVRFPLSYPNGRPDMFWVDEGLLLANGAVPQSAEHIEEVLGKKRRRFSWHPQDWNPGRDNLLTYLEFVNNRLSKRV